jgi:2-polyprenyl-3-methyl-5-hydroxy-6-metoxy-1,4-benzoquinol methylase
MDGTPMADFLLPLMRRTYEAQALRIRRETMKRCESEMKSTSEPDYLPDHLYARLFQPWTLPESEWPLCKEDWARVDAITALPWRGHILDMGAGDCTLAAMVCSRNPLVKYIRCVEPDQAQLKRAFDLWCWNGIYPQFNLCDDIGSGKAVYDGALCCEVLEHLTPETGLALLKQIRAACKPGAMVCVTVPDEHGSRATYPGHISYFGHGELCDVLLKTGFRPTVTSDRLGTIWLMGLAYA